jgi:Flp pilus assembly protein TadB
MLRFLFGILLVQAATAGLVLTAGIDLSDWRGSLPTLIAIVTVGVVAAFWFATVAGNLRRDELERLRASFARQREDLRVKAEREKTRLARQSRKTLDSESRRAESRANRKVAVTVAGASALGVVMIFASSLALGLSLLTGAGGAVAGYLAGRRWPPSRLSDRLSVGKPINQLLRRQRDSLPKQIGD